MANSSESQYSAWYDPETQTMNFRIPTPEEAADAELHILIYEMHINRGNERELQYQSRFQELARQFPQVAAKYGYDPRFGLWKYHLNYAILLPGPHWN